MEKKKVITFIILFIFVIISINLISIGAFSNSTDINQTNITNSNLSIADSVNKAGIQYNDKILTEFDNSQWVSVLVSIKDTSGITISKEDSIDIQRFKDLKRNTMLISITDNILSNLSDQEFQLKSKSEFGGFFAGNITREGFDELINDSRINAIYENSIKGKNNLDESIPLINADDVHNLGYNGTKQTICVIDTGINYSHLNLGGCFGSGCKVKSGYDYVNGDSNPMDDDGHGTHVAGIIASTDFTYKGSSLGVELVALKAGDSNGNYTGEEVVYALQWCYNNRNTYNISVVSMSFGWSDGCVENFANEIIDDLYDAGITLIASSGNEADYEEIAYPACNDQVISVGATYDENISSFNSSICNDSTTFADKIACWGNRADNLNLLAPGCSITSTNISGGFASICGTSMAVPHVAGAAALLLQKNPSLTPDEIRDVLQYTGVDVYDSETGLTFKRIDVLAAINLLNSTTLCYQESANVSTACGGLNTGRYTDSGNWEPSSGTGNVMKTYDKSWSTWGFPFGTTISYLNINYTKPNGALNTSFLKVRDSVASTRNIGISQSCWNYNATTLMLRAEVRRNVPTGVYGVNWSCYNGSWTFLSNADGDSLLYEEGMYWVIPSSSSSTWCYQEFANVSSACGGLNTGRYTNSSNWDSSAGNVKKTYEGDWSTWGYPSGTAISYLNINYTKPTGALSTSILKVKDSVASTRNVSILQSCWNYNATTLMLKSEVRRNVPGGVYGVNWSCYNGATWAFLSNGDGDSLLYEEGMWWNINS